MKTEKHISFSSPIIFLVFLFSSILTKADEITDTMKNYCVVPPFMEVNTKPNIIIVQDFSGSMQYPAYYTASYNISVNYDKNKIYYGYFKNNAYYKYDTTNGYWLENTSCSADSNNIGTSNQCISGNFLNFITMSRIDTSLKALIGGKIEDCGNGKCLITRGMYRKVYDNTSKCTIILGPSNTFNRYYYYYYDSTQYNSSNYDMKINISGDNCSIGNIYNAWLRIYTPTQPTGILQANEDLGNFAYIVFAGNGRYGEIRVGLNEYKTNGMDLIIQKMMNEFPYSTTPTGSSLWEVYDYLKQSNEHNGLLYEDNINYIAKGTEKDPFYEDSLGQLIPCKQNVVILISDGEWNVGDDPAQPSYSLHTSDLRDDLEGNQNALVFSLFVFSTSENGQNAMKTVAATGTFNDLDGDNYPYNININNNSLDISYPRPNCNPNGTYDDECKEWDKNLDGQPDGYFYASDGQTLENAMKTIFNAIRKYSYSGGAVAVLGERDNESSATAVVLKGSVLTQSLFFTQKYGVDWVGKVYGYWYNLTDGTIREDTDSNKILNPTIDKIIEFALENEKTLIVNRYNVKADGTKGDLDVKLYDTDEINYLFETGYNLWADFNESNEDESDDRLIYFAACEKGENCLKEFRYTTLSDFMFSKSYESNIFRIPLLGFPAECFNMCNYFDGMTSFDFIEMWNQFLECLNSNNDYEKLIKYIRGQDFVGWRNRTAGGRVWKLGDIIHSSPKIVHYDDKNVIIVGANDGMLHVFELGKSTDKGLTGNNYVKLEGENIGKELWAFIPLNMLPYLRFLADPNYCHTYYVDSSVYVFDTKDGRKILIGAMRLGGGTGDITSSTDPKYKPVNPPKWACPTTLWDFMKEQCESCASNFSFFNFMCSWIPSTPPDYSSCIGLSSYFALDITDINNPKFLWEFSHPDLGFTYSGPAVIEKSNDTYVMFGSGPTNYYGNSNQNLKFFTIKLDGSNINSPYIIDTGISNAFSGRLFTKGFDADNDGYTDFVFVGYARRDGDMNNWKGGLLKIDVRDSIPSNWTTTSYFTDAQSPITAKVEIGKCFGRDYIYFGTGRWFYKADNSLPGQKNRLYGTPLVCERDKDGNIVNCAPLTDVDTNPNNVCINAQNNILRGWYIELDLGDNDYYKERDITDIALTNQNVVLFTTIEPTKDPCKFGGRTRIWALNCATGGSIVDECLYQAYNIDKNKLKGAALLQLSGGNIQQISLKEIANEQATNNSKTTNWFTGTAPEGAPSFVYPAPPLKGEILLWLER